MRYVAIDSNIFVSSLDPGDVFHNECYPIFERLLREEFNAICSCLVLVETVCVISRRLNYEKIATDVYNELASLSSIQWIDITSEIAARACLLGIETTLKGGDAIILQTARKFAIPLVTKDKRDKK
ncbi:MAG: PIN domain-containing protein [Magnetococcales bacterium]|uniref:PIN domain-containing protein n=1 Tax=Candidatus Magnetobacterium casense TaxID=1455061 RepID=A0ABS6RY70_9BACT|nr:PIN domain-containing protein [Candidatus Magnetobacterium casensis]MBF0607935.1 PIN domain-containing protein [Nitrospirota bacterium]MBV6341592.1 PIN domain-containing protein [Candidatus Magnetobacterium casensis]